MDPLTIAALASAGAGLAGGVKNMISGNSQQNRLMGDQKAAREEALRQQLQLINEQSAPVMHDYTKAYANRLLTGSALETPISQDPYTQGARSELLGGGAKALAGVANKQRAAGVSRGGFSNIGSIQDIEDRMSQALAGLAERAQQGRLQRVGEAAQIGQTYADKAIAFENAKKQAQAAAYAGDLAGALQGIGSAQALAAQQNAQQGQLFGGLLGLGGTLGGKAIEQKNLADLFAKYGKGSG